MKYSEKVMQNFMKPKNMGEMKNPDSVGRVGNPMCGDIMEVYLKIDKKTSKIKDIKFKTFGCMAAIATSSMITQLAKGKTLKQAKRISHKDVSNSLKGLPPIKEHCSNLASNALKKAIENYNRRLKK